MNASMFRRLMVFVAVAALLLSSLACLSFGGGKETEEPGPEPEEPTQEQPEQPEQPPSGGELDYSLDPTFGAIALETGFTPDPASVAVVSGGPVDVTSLGGGCVGFAAEAPDVRLNWDGFGFLRFLFVSDEEGADASLVISGPDGQWYCGDDSFDTLNPTVDFDDAQSGQYDIWIGSYNAEDFISGVLYITELEYTPADVAALGDMVLEGDELDFSYDPNFGSAELTSGFADDPYPIDMVSGGGVDTTYLGGSCVGWAAVSPDFRVFWNGTGFLRFYFVGEGDTSLIINTPDGSFYCNDDSFDTFNPTIDFATAPAGQYDVWIGSYEEGSFVSGTLFITELDTNHP